MAKIKVDIRECLCLYAYSVFVNQMSLYRHFHVVIHLVIFISPKIHYFTSRPLIPHGLALNHCMWGTLTHLLNER